jgi:hypothetical protein
MMSDILDFCSLLWYKFKLLLMILGDPIRTLLLLTLLLFLMLLLLYLLLLCYTNKMINNSSELMWEVRNAYRIFVGKP